MDNMLIILFSTIAISFIHTLIGPDHYLPLVAIAKTRNWTLAKTVFITLICGIAHVLSAILLGVLAILFGITLKKISLIEHLRGNFAAWILIGFGLAYISWSVYTLIHDKHSHQHAAQGKNITLWVLILVFLLGPCEPLIPIMIYAAIQSSLWFVFGISAIFGVITIITMLTLVTFSVFGTKLINLPFLEKYGHTMAGIIICFSGFAIKWL